MKVPVMLGGVTPVITGQGLGAPELHLRRVCEAERDVQRHAAVKRAAPHEKLEAVEVREGDVWVGGVQVHTR